MSSHRRPSCVCGHLAGPLSMSVFPHLFSHIAYSSSLSPLLSLFCFQSIRFPFSSTNPFHSLSVTILLLFHASLSFSSSLTVVNAMWQGAHSLHAIETVQRLLVPCLHPVSMLLSVSMRQRGCSSQHFSIASILFHLILCGPSASPAVLLSSPHICGVWCFLIWKGAVLHFFHPLCPRMVLFLFVTVG